jgi:hypothetical protein
MDEYFAGKKFTDLNITATRIADWEKILKPLVGRVKSVLEVGSCEGGSALFWYKFFGANVECIDNWQAPLHGVPPEQVEANFDANVADTSIIKLKHDSTVGLHVMAKMGMQYDLIYIDGDHCRDQVMIDSCLAWRLLKPGGMMIWDDWENYQRGTTDTGRPERAIACFVDLQDGALKIIADTGQQLFAIKRK